MEQCLEEINTPFNAFEIFTQFQNKKHIAFLDSCADFQELSEYSLVGLNPFLILKGNKKKCFVNEEEYACDVFCKLNEFMCLYQCANETKLPLVSGCIGYISYDYAAENESDMLTTFVFYDNFIIFDHKENKTYISACGILNAAKESIAAIQKEIDNIETACKEDCYKSTAEFHSNFTKESYIKGLEKAKSYITEGDIYVINIAQQFTAKTRRSAYAMYKDLRSTNPAPFSAFISCEDFNIISSSPERFIKIENRKVETRPVKGTVPRGNTKTEDKINMQRLLNSQKDKEELLMIVDLQRNDLSVTCKKNTVKVKELYKLEQYSTVFQLVSTIVGELKDNITAVDCIKSCFPGGSITGAPKIRATEIIKETEGKKRGLYTGCLGYFSFDGNADFNIIIRTIIHKDDTVTFGVGGGITYKSVEEDEYHETLDKAKALMRVI